MLEDGIIEGRRVFDNILKYIRMGASSNFGNMFSRGRRRLPPALPPHGPDPDPPQQPPLRRLADGHPPRQRRRRGRRSRRRSGTSAHQEVHGPHRADLARSSTTPPSASCWCVFGCSAWLAPADRATKAHLEQLFHTGWFVESLLTQTLIVHIIRTNRIPFFQSRASLAMTFTTADGDGDGHRPALSRPSPPSSASCRCRAGSGSGSSASSSSTRS